VCSSIEYIKTEIQLNDRVQNLYFCICILFVTRKGSSRIFLRRLRSLVSADWWKLLANQSADTKLRKRHRNIMLSPIPVYMQPIFCSRIFSIEFLFVVFLFCELRRYSVRIPKPSVRATLPRYNDDYYSGSCFVLFSRIYKNESTLENWCSQKRIVKAG